MEVNMYEIVLILASLTLVWNVGLNICFLLKERRGKRRVHLGLFSLVIVMLYPFIICGLDSLINGAISEELYQRLLR